MENTRRKRRKPLSDKQLAALAYGDKLRSVGCIKAHSLKLRDLGLFPIKQTTEILSFLDAIKVKAKKEYLFKRDFPGVMEE